MPNHGPADSRRAAGLIQKALLDWGPGEEGTHSLGHETSCLFFNKPLVTVPRAALDETPRTDAGSAVATTSCHISCWSVAKK